MTSTRFPALNSKPPVTLSVGFSYKPTMTPHRHWRSLNPILRPPLETKLRSGWSRFVMSLIHRGPDEIALFSSQVAEHVAAAEQKFEENYATLRLTTDPEKFEEFALKRPSNPPGRAAAMLIQ